MSLNFLNKFLVSGLLELPKRWNSFSMVKVFKTLCPKHHPTGMNIIDLLAILPFYIELIQPSDIPNVSSNLHETDSKEMLFTTPSISTTLPTTTLVAEEEVERVGGMDDVLQVFRIFKLARILKLAR